jgi:hypothetical protein
MAAATLLSPLAQARVPERNGSAFIGLRVDNSTARAIQPSITTTPFAHEKGEVVQAGGSQSFSIDLYPLPELHQVRVLVTDTDGGGAIASCEPVRLPVGEQAVYLRVEVTGEGERMLCTLIERKLGTILG